MQGPHKAVWTLWGHSFSHRPAVALTPTHPTHAQINSERNVHLELRRATSATAAASALTTVGGPHGGGGGNGGGSRRPQHQQQMAMVEAVAAAAASEGLRKQARELQRQCQELRAVGLEDGGYFGCGPTGPSQARGHIHTSQ